MALGVPRAGPYFAPRVSKNTFTRAQDEMRRLKRQVQDLEARNKELRDKNEELVIKAEEKDTAINEMIERLERMKVIMEGIHGDMLDK